MFNYNNDNTSLIVSNTPHYINRKRIHSTFREFTCWYARRRRLPPDGHVGQGGVLVSVRVNKIIFRSNSAAEILLHMVYQGLPGTDARPTRSRSVNGRAVLPGLVVKTTE